MLNIREPVFLRGTIQIFLLSKNQGRYDLSISSAIASKNMMTYLDRWSKELNKVASIVKQC